ncbi:MAG: TonB-dependent receptor [Candidatus Ferrigenium altingense]|jgi:outer membrane receptor protein involved in Fe transport
MMFTRKATLVAALAAIITLAPAAAGAVTLNIPEQTMAGALKSLSEQAKVQIIFSPDAVEGKRAPVISGDLTPGQALQKILGNSGLGYKANGEGTFAVQAQNNASPKANPMLDEVVVTATRTERRAKDVPASVSVISAKDIARQRPAKVQDLLRNVEGVDISEQQSVAHASSPTLRGVGGSFAGNTTQILVNGVATDSVVSAVIGRGGLNFTSAQDIERIEVLRGPASALYGPGVIGGVINVITKRGGGKLGGEVNAGYGSHNLRSIGAAIGGGTDTADFRLSVYDAQSDGYIAQPDYAFGGKDLGPRDWKDGKISFVGGLRPSDNQEITLGMQNFGTRSALLGGHPNHRQNFDGDAWTLGYRYDFSEKTTVKANYRKTRLKQQAIWDQEYWNGLAGDLAPAWSFGRYSDSDSLEVQVDTRLSENNQLTAGVSHDTGTHTTRSTSLAGAGTVTINNARTTGLFVQDEHRFGDFAVTIGGRQDRISLYGDTKNGASLNPGSTANVFNPRLGARYSMTPDTSFYASAGTAYLPAPNSLRFMGSPFWLDNPSLKPESSTSFEVGLNQNFGWGALRAALFQTDYRDKLTSILVGVNKRQYQNIGKVAVNGFELSMQGQLDNSWQPYANYAYTDSIIKENPTNPLSVSKQVQRVSPHKLNLGLAYVPDSSWAANVAGHYVGPKYFNDTNTANQRAGGYFVADAKITAKLPVSGNAGDWEAYAAVNNLTGKIYQEWAVYEYSDRRTFSIGVNGRF